MPAWLSILAEMQGCNSSGFTTISLSGGPDAAKGCSSGQEAAAVQGCSARDRACVLCVHFLWLRSNLIGVLEPGQVRHNGGFVFFGVEALETLWRLCGFVGSGFVC